jgi:hypothetical protein
MGRRDRAAGAPIAVYGGARGGLTLHSHSISRRHEVHPLTDAAARVETGEALAARLTTRQLVALGAFDFADKKRHGSEIYLTIQSPEFLWTITVDPIDQWRAQAFVDKVNETAGTEA